LAFELDSGSGAGLDGGGDVVDPADEKASLEGAAARADPADPDDWARSAVWVVVVVECRPANHTPPTATTTAAAAAAQRAG
jgi:hypothetical protein